MFPAQRVGLMLLAGLLLAGCNQRSPFLNPGGQSAWTGSAAGANPNQLAQVQQLEKRVSQLDANNQDLHSQLAKAQQQSQVYADLVGSLRQQLSDTTVKLRETEAARVQLTERTQQLQALTCARGGAAITANSSVRNSLVVADIPGLDVIQEDDVIRVVLPADKLFLPGSAQLISDAGRSLDLVADTILRHYPRQRVVIEGHTDSGPQLTATSATNHQLAAQQALTVFDHLTRRQRLPARQLTVMGTGANHPRVSNASEAGRSKNRRVEIVIYPEEVR